MKKINKLVAAALSLLFIISLAMSCDDLNDIQSKYADRAEQVYLGKVDSIKTIPGFGRGKITWYIGADPKIEQTVIYWNMRSDSIVKDLTRSVSGILKDSIIIENLPEGSHLFEFRNKNSKEESSLFSSTTVTVWGVKYADDLIGRKFTSTEFDNDESSYTLVLSAASPDLMYSQFVYTDNTGTEKTIKLDRKADTVKLVNLSAGSEFRLRHLFFRSRGIDTLYTNYQVYNAPKAVFDNGMKLTLQGNTDSRYFSRGDTSIYEWNAAGDVIIYKLNGDGSFTKTETYAALAPRTKYREFFFYDEDRFISISVGNAATMHRIVNGALILVGAAAGFGSGFDMKTFLRAEGFFYSITTTGAIRTWLARNNASWGTPNGTTVGTNFMYDPVIVFNKHHLVGVDAKGYLWSIPITSTGGLGAKSKIGSGWNKFVKLVNVGTTLLAMDANGDFYKFDFNTDDFWIL